MKLKKKSGAIIGTKISGLNLPSFQRPSFADGLRFPDDITQLTSQNVSELIGKYTKLLCYVQEQYTNHAVKVMRLESAIQTLQSTVFIESPGIAHLEKWKRDQRMQSDSRMMGINIQLTEAKKFKELAYSYIQNYERCISALSRELTRKTASGDGARYGRSGA